MKPRIWKDTPHMDSNGYEYPSQWVLEWDEHIAYHDKLIRRYASWDTWNQAIKCLAAIYGYGMVHRNA